MGSDADDKKRDIMLALYYEGGTMGLFDPFDDAEPRDDLDVTFCEGVLAASPEHVEALAFLGSVYTKRGEHQKGLEMDLRLLRLRPESPRVHYNLACSYALLGRADEAFAALDRALEYGFSDGDHLSKDDDLASLRTDPRYDTLLAKLKPGRSVEEA